MSFIIPSTYYQRNVDWELLKPTWVPTSQSIVRRILDGEPTIANSASESPLGYAVAKEFWEGGYFEFRFSFQAATSDRTVIGLIDYNSDPNNLLRDDFEYAFRSASGFDIVERGLGGLPNGINVPTSYLRIVISPHWNNGLPVYQGSSNGVDWETAYKSDANYLYNNDGSPKRLYPAIRYSKLFGGSVQLYNTQVTQRDASFGRATSYFIASYEEPSYWNLLYNPYGTRTLINDTQGGYDFQVSNALNGNDNVGATGSEWYTIYFPELKGGKNPYHFTYRYERYGSSDGVWYAFKDSNDQMIFRIRAGDSFATHSVDDATGNHTIFGSSNANAGNWLLEDLYFDWSRGKYYLGVYTQGGSLRGEISGDLIYNTDLEYIEVQKQDTNTADAIDSFVIYDEDVYGYLDYSIDPVTLNSDHMRRFENGSLSGFTVNDNNFEIKNYSRRGNKSVGIEETGTTVSDIAYYEPTELSGGSKPFYFETNLYIPTTVSGTPNAGFSLVNSNGDDEMAFFFDDTPSFGVYDGNGTSYDLQSIKDGGGQWVTVRVWLHWGHNRFMVYMRQDNTAGGLNTNLYEDYGRPMAHGVDVEKIKFKNIGDETDWTIGGTNDINMVWDQIRINDENI